MNDNVLTAPEERVLLLEGVHNFRDFGGYATAGGGRLKRGLLWRSGQHFGATDADLDRIAGLGLASVFDLRSAKERMTHPCRRPAGFVAAVHLIEEAAPAAGPAQSAAPHLAEAQQAAAQTPRLRDVASTREGLRRNYASIAFRPALVQAMRRYLAELAAGKGPSLINCMAGKDRTGVAVAMAQLAAGAHRDDVLADYVLTNSAGDVEARIVAGMETIRVITGQLDEDVLRVLMGVEAEYLETTLSVVAEKHGSIDGYLADMLGADAGMRDRLRGALVEN